MVMNIGFTEVERIIIVLAELLYCLAYTYAAWYFMKRNHRAEEIPQMVRILTVLILFLTSLLTFRQENALLYAGCGMLIPFLMLALILALYLNGDTLLLIYGYGSLAAAVLGLVLLHLLVIYLFGYMIGQQKKNLQYQLYEQQREMMMHQYRELEEKYQASRKVIHDVKNHIQMIGELYHMGDLEAADRYCNDIGGMLRSLERVTYTDHRMLNLILNEKLNIQEMKGARLRIEIGQADLSFMKDIDVTTVFSNLLDNAREAVAECEEDCYLSLKMDEAKDFLVICLRNSCPAKRKKRKGHEGLGLVNARHVVESYGGTMQVSRLKDGYQTSITIPIERGEEK